MSVRKGERVPPGHPWTPAAITLVVAFWLTIWGIWGFAVWLAPS